MDSFTIIRLINNMLLLLFFTFLFSLQAVSKHDCNLDDKKRTDFIARAIAESQR